MVDVATAPSAEVAYAPTPSLVTAAPLGTGTFGMSLGGGYTAILPLFTGEIGYGLSRRIDITFRYETVSGLFHYPQVAFRWAFLDAGKWTFAARFGLAYSLFAVKSDQTNLTSTVYLTPELIASRPVTKSTDLLAAFRTDFDLWEYRIVEGEKRPEGTFRFDAFIFKVGAKTQIMDDLALYVIGSLRVPTENYTYRAEQFYVLPSIEVGGTWTW
jgi:hypothetical protein